MYVLAPNETVEAFPYTVSNLKRDNPQISFPEDISDELLAEFSVFPVTSTTETYDPATQILTQNGCTYNTSESRWETAWVIYDKTPQELQADLDLRASEIRLERNRRLSECDWTQLPDAPVDSAAWATYRQALRDITDQSGFPTQITWPLEPG